MRTHGDLIVLPHWETRLSASWPDITLSQSPDTEPTSPFRFLIMPSAKYQFYKSLIWLDYGFTARKTRVLPIQRMHPVSLFSRSCDLNPLVRTMVWIKQMIDTCDFLARHSALQGKGKAQKGKFVLFNDSSRAHWFSYHQLLDINHIVIVPYFFRGNPLSPCRLLLPISTRDLLCTLSHRQDSTEDSPNCKCYKVTMTMCAHCHKSVHILIWPWMLPGRKTPNYQPTN